MKNSRNTGHRSDRRNDRRYDGHDEESFVFPNRNDPTGFDDSYYEEPYEDYGSYDNYDDYDYENNYSRRSGNNSYDREYDERVSYDNYGRRPYEEDFETPPENLKKRRRRKEKVQRNDERDGAASGTGKNREILVIMYAFVFLFVATVGYFIYFNAVESKNIINHPGNVHLAKLRDKNTKGRILASDGTVLAQTVTDGYGNEKRSYPYANVFAHVVGTSDINKSGLESSNEGDMLLSNANPVSRAFNELRNIKNPGDDIVTTLDLDLQGTAYYALGNNQGVVVAIEPSTGKVLAMVSKPDYDPNSLEANFESIISDSTSKVLLNQATQGLFTPGSIFKICTTLEYTRENPSYGGYSYNCQGGINLSDGAGGSQMMACYHGTVHGTQDLTRSFANSCNASFANIGTSLNVKQFSQLADSLLFNTKLPTDISHVKSSFSLNSSDSEWVKGATAIGQGNTTMTPLHAAMLTSAIANGGILMEPYLVDRVQSNDGHTVKKYMPDAYGSLMTTDESALLTALMTETVNSGTATALSGLGYSVAGKTGTAEVDNFGNNAWFVGFAPADNPQIAVCVLVENASTSSSYVAVPIAQQLFYAYLNNR